MQIGPFFPQNGPFFPQNALFIHFSYEFCTFLIHSTIHSIVRQKYSFKNNLIIHSMKIFYFKKCRIIYPYPRLQVQEYSIRNRRFYFYCQQYSFMKYSHQYEIIIHIYWIFYLLTAAWSSF